MKFAKFLRTPSSKENLQWLLLQNSQNVLWRLKIFSFEASNRSSKVFHVRFYFCMSIFIRAKYCCPQGKTLLLSFEIIEKFWYNLTFRSSLRKCSIKKCFPVKFAKFLRTHFFRNTSGGHFFKSGWFKRLITTFYQPSYLTSVTRFCLLFITSNLNVSFFSWLSICKSKTKTITYSRGKSMTIYEKIPILDKWKSSEYAPDSF